MTQTRDDAGGERQLAPLRRAFTINGRVVIAASAIVAAAAATIPLAYLVVRVSESDPADVIAALWRPRTLDLLINTAGLVLAVSATCLVLGVATAWVLTRTDLACRRAWLIITTLPLAIPSYVAAFGWVATTPLRGFWGAWLVLTMCNLPLVTLPTIAALRQAHAGAEDVARTMGRGPLGAFFAGTWPQVRPAAIAGTLLVALYVLSDFGAVAIMRYQAFTWAIHTAYGALFDRTLAAVLSVVLALMGILLVMFERRARGARKRLGSAVQARTPVVPVRLHRRSWPVHAGLAAVTSLSLGVPLAALTSFLVGRGDSAFSVSAADLAGDVWSTVALAGAGALIALALAMPIGILSARFPSRLSNATESASYLGLALPGIVVGLALVFFSLTVVPALYQSAIILAFAYGVLFLPKAVGAVRTSIEQVEPGLEEVARTLGSSPADVWRRVTFRMAWPGIGAGVLLVALTAMKELPATLLLRPTGVDTLATSLWRYTESSAYGAAAPYAVMLIVVATVPAILLTREATAGTRLEPTARSRGTHGE